MAVVGQQAGELLTCGVVVRVGERPQRGHRLVDPAVRRQQFGDVQDGVAVAGGGTDMDTKSETGFQAVRNGV